MAQLMSWCASSSSSPSRGGRVRILSLMHVGRRGYVPMLSTSSAGARLKLGVLKGRGLSI